MSTSLCESCHQRPKFSDGTVTYSYCSKTCATNRQTAPATMAQAPTTAAASTSGLCDVCKVRPRYQDTSGKTHPYCGKKCAAAGAAAAPTTAPPSAPSTTATATPVKKAKGTCKAPNCAKPAFANSDGTLADYCSFSHKKIGETLCLMCRKVAKMQKSHFCSQACETQAEQMGPVILQVPRNHVTFRSVEEQFVGSWRHSGKPCPSVRRVFKIVSSKQALEDYNAYRDDVEARGHFRSTGRSAGNENRRWHGTRRECSVGDKGQTSLCSSPKCSLCSIIKNSFDLNLWGTATKWGRFGKGIYTSSTASKSNDYSWNVGPSKLKAILLNKVVVGKGYKMYNDDTTRTAAPAGYDSVLAEVGGSLNYDELVVYSNNAIRPSFLVMYDDL